MVWKNDLRVLILEEQAFSFKLTFKRNSEWTLFGKLTYCSVGWWTLPKSIILFVSLVWAVTHWDALFCVPVIFLKQLDTTILTVKKRWTFSRKEEATKRRKTIYRLIIVVKQCLFRRKNEEKPQSLWTNKRKCSLNWNKSEKNIDPNFCLNLTKLLPQFYMKIVKPHQNQIGSNNKAIFFDGILPWKLVKQKIDCVFASKNR